MVLDRLGAGPTGPGARHLHVAARRAQRPEPGPTVIALRPAAEPRPALKYRLVPERGKLVAGNASVFYHRAIQFVLMQRNALISEEKPAPGSPGSADQQLADWGNLPIADIPRDLARKRLERFDSALKEIELGATRASCDWEFDLRNEGFTLLLPEIQEMRTLARLVSLHARLAILDGKLDDAMHWTQVGLVMGRHVSDGPIIIQSLVGVAIDSTMVKCLEDLIQAPGMPSLVWALVDRPHPFIDLRHALEGERYLLEREIPELTELDRGIWSVDQAQRFAGELDRKLFPLIAGESVPGTGAAVPITMPAAARRLGIAALCAKVYPEAKRALIAQGRPEATVEAMPVIQVSALYCIQEYQKHRDDNFKWFNVPVWQSFNKVDMQGSTTPQQKMSNPLLALFEMLNPAFNAVRNAPVRLERSLDALQCVEAIRMHAASHGGKLPESLDAITDAPIPLDPGTGKPFSYKLEGESALLSAPVPPGARIIPRS